MNAIAQSQDGEASHTSQPTSLLQQYRRHAYFFLPISMLTIALGSLLHIVRLFVGDDYLFRHIMTPAFDRWFFVPILYCGISGALGWRELKFNSGWHRAFMAVVVAYMLISIPIHLTTYFTGSVEHMRSFPIWVSVVLQPYYAVIEVSLWRTTLKSSSAAAS